MNILMLIKRKKPIIYLIRIEWIFIWVNLNPLHPRMFVAKFGCNWSSGSGEENYLISSMYFCYFLIISPWKKTGPFIWTNLNPLHQRMLCAKFDLNWPSGSGEDENVKSLRQQQQWTTDFWSEKLKNNQSTVEYWLL